MVKIKEVEGAIEAILFTMGESVELSRIAKAVEVDPKTTEKIIHNMMDRYQEEGRDSDHRTGEFFPDVHEKGIL